MFRDQGPGELLAAAAQPVDPLGAHRCEIRRIGVGHFARHQIAGRVFKLAVVLPQIGKDNGA